MIRKLKNLKHLLVAFLAVLFYRYPAKRLTVIGVTGTDGKTTTVSLIYHILTNAGLSTAMISTLGAKINGKDVPIGLHVTTPSSFSVQRLLHQAVGQGVKYVVLEVTSHGLDQHRLLGCNFNVAVITNVTKEHLDYHRAYGNYLKTKSKLFRDVRYAVLNKDDFSYKHLLSVIKEEMTFTISYGIKSKANFTPENYPFKTNLLGEFNQYNCLAGICVAKIFEIRDKVIREALLSFDSPKGRLEEVKVGQDFKIFVDFAHTPAAFEKIIPTVRKLVKGKIIHVFGCTGERDTYKRPIMGEIAARLDDEIILTHEDTNREDPDKIINEIEPGVKKGGKILGKDYWKVADRREAIRKATQLAKKDDLVLITGVGHQVSLNIGGKEVPWSDQNVVKEILKNDVFPSRGGEGFPSYVAALPSLCSGGASPRRSRTAGSACNRCNKK